MYNYDRVYIISVFNPCGMTTPNNGTAKYLYIPYNPPTERRPREINGVILYGECLSISRVLIKNPIIITIIIIIIIIKTNLGHGGVPDRVIINSSPRAIFIFQNFLYSTINFYNNIRRHNISLYSIL